MEKMDRSALLVLHHYNDYATRLVLETASKLTLEELTRQFSPSHGTVKGLLLHYLLCEHGFLLRCGVTPFLDDITDPEDLDFDGIRDLFTRISAVRLEYLEKVSEGELDEVIETRDHGQTPAPGALADAGASPAAIHPSPRRAFHRHDQPGLPPAHPRPHPAVHPRERTGMAVRLSFPIQLLLHRVS